MKLHKQWDKEKYDGHRSLSTKRSKLENLIRNLEIKLGFSPNSIIQLVNCAQVEWTHIKGCNDPKCVIEVSIYSKFKNPYKMRNQKSSRREK
jgi:hypothetical protein